MIAPAASMAAHLAAHLPLTGPEFAALMAPFAPFEPAPRLAVAVSGGADSLALALLADPWARAHGGDVLALVLDHGLRASSAEEARRTIATLAARGIAARLIALPPGSIGPAGVQAEARRLRLDLLAQACREAGILHLLLGHHRLDQAETVLLRRLDASGPFGLAGMPAERSLAFVRLLRPLLDVPPARLRATLRAAGLEWIEDPSNRDPRFTRARLRLELGDAGGIGAGVAALAAAAACRAQGRAAREADVAALAAAAVTLRPEGWALLDPGPLAAADAGVARVLLAALLAAIAGAPYPPRGERLGRLRDRLAQAAAAGASWRGGTLGGCRILPAGRFGRGLWLVCREAAAMAPPAIIALAPEEGGGTRSYLWDGRFLVEIPAATLAQGGGAVSLGALGAEGAAALPEPARAALAGLPGAVRATLPALRLGGALQAVPHLGYAVALFAGARMAFLPPRPMAGAPFAGAAQAARAHPERG